MICRVCGGRAFARGHQWEYDCGGRRFIEWDEVCRECGYPARMGPREVSSS
jgi:ribosomal protein L37E